MSKVLKDPIAPKERSDGVYPWSYKAPSYDNRTSCSIPAGDHYGSGFKNPIGKERASSITKGPIPQESHCFSPDEVFRGEDKKG